MFYTFIVLDLLCDLRDIHDVTGNARISATTNNLDLAAF